MTTTLEVVSRASAIASGQKRYFTGEPCKHGHVAERAVSNHTCLTCSQLKKQRAYSENPDPVIARRMAAYRSNKIAEREGMRAYYHSRLLKDPEYNRAQYAANREARIAESRAWALANPGKRRAQNAKRKALQRNALPVWYGEFDDFVSQEAAELARLRESVTGYAWHVDHMIPLQAREACGLHCGLNLQVIPASVNISKNNRMVFTQPMQWLACL